MLNAREPLLMPECFGMSPNGWKYTNLLSLENLKMSRGESFPRGQTSVFFISDYQSHARYCNLMKRSLEMIVRLMGHLLLSYLSTSHASQCPYKHVKLATCSRSLARNFNNWHFLNFSRWHISRPRSAFLSFVSKNEWQKWQIVTEITSNPQQVERWIAHHPSIWSVGQAPRKKMCKRTAKRWCLLALLGLGA